MKKRLFAGALALLMIIGLLPVSSMLKKPVEAQAAQKTSIYSVGSQTKGTISGSIGTDGRFTLSGTNTFSIDSPGSYSDGKKEYGFKLGTSGPAKQCVKFTPKTSKAKLTIKGIYKSSRNAVVSLKGADENAQNKTIAKISGSSAEKFEISFDIESNADTEYSLYRSDGGTVYINTIELTEDPYTITVNDEKAAEDSQTVSTFYKEGDTVSLSAADTDNFLYWETSHGRIISRESSTTLTAYYDETYTAVYGSDVTVYYMTAYNQIYKSVASNDFDSSSEQPAGPIRYGYKFTGWNKSASDIQTEIESGTTKKIFVDPKYDQDTTTKYTVTVDTTALTDDGKSVDTEYTINDVATASTSSAEFAYWKDAETGKVLSYNSTYYFFANKDMKVVAVNKSEATSDSEGVISLVFNGTNDDGDSVVIFEYTVPSDCTVKFAGVYASPDSSKLTKDSADFVDGGVFNSKNTYKYTITKTKGMSTWYVMPVLEYTDSNGETVTKTLSAETF